MPKIDVQVDCNNAPKKTLLRDFTLAFIKGQKNIILDNIDDNIEWEMVGEHTIRGIKEVESLMGVMLDKSMEEIIIEGIVTHGDEGCVMGVMKFNNNKTYKYCDFYTFTSHAKDAKIKKLTSFVMEVE